MIDKLKYFIEAWEMNGVGNTVATVQDSPGTVVTITLDELRALAAASAQADEMHICGERDRQFKTGASAYAAPSPAAREAGDRVTLTDERIIKVARKAAPPFPWGIGSTRAIFLQAVREILREAGAR